MIVIIHCISSGHRPLDSFLYPCSSWVAVIRSVSESAENPYQNEVRGSDLNPEQHEKSEQIHADRLYVVV